MRKVLLLICLALVVGIPMNIVAWPGCCSHHDGVCSYLCSDGIHIGYKCCDGTPLSDIRAPHYPSCPASTTTTTTSTSTSTTTTLGGECDLPGDYPSCGEVTLGEVVDFINQWAQSEAELSEVIDLINAWANG